VYRREAAALNAMQVDLPEDDTLMGGYMRNEANEAPLVFKRKTLFVCLGSSGLFPPNIWPTWLSMTFSKLPIDRAFVPERELLDKEIPITQTK
jgi:hypothetical protein